MGSGGTPPSGTVTFLFTDVERSTSLWQSDGASMPTALAAHDTLIRSQVAEHGGYVFSTAGDSFAVSVAASQQALGAAVAVQAALAEQDWPSGLTLRVRMSLHTGVADERDRGTAHLGPEQGHRCREHCELATWAS